jgi:hypothetical protein
MATPALCTVALTVIVAVTCGCRSQSADHEPVSTLTPKCSYDRAQMLSLDEQAFDQHPGGGWRTLADIDECIGVAADLVRDYRLSHPPRKEVLTGSDVLYWHEAQLRATMGSTEEAIDLFKKSRRPDEWSSGFNEYTDATIAFLEHDQPALVKARAALVAVRRPADWSGPWPLNVDVVDGLIRCFGQPYKRAYSDECRK